MPIRNVERAKPALPWQWAPTITFSSSVMVGNSARFWNVRAMPSRAMPWAGTRQQVVAPEQHPALGRLVDAADDVEHRRLARTVRTDQPADLTFVDREAELVEREDATESHRHALNIEKTHLAPVPPSAVAPGCVDWHTVVLRGDGLDRPFSCEADGYESSRRDRRRARRDRDPAVVAEQAQLGRARRWPLRCCAQPSDG